MINSLGEPQSVLLLGGTSDIGLATVRAWARTCRPRVTLAARPGSAPYDGRSGATCPRPGGNAEVDFDALDTNSHVALV